MWGEGPDSSIWPVSGVLFAKLADPGRDGRVHVRRIPGLQVVPDRVDGSRRRGCVTVEEPLNIDAVLPKCPASPLIRMSAAPPDARHSPPILS
jgi:hypothetical protein